MSPLNTKAEKEAYLINEQSWDERTRIHLGSAFYDIDGFLKGKSSLNPPELGLLGELRGKKVLHLQCHFAQDSLSMVRLGAEVTGVDLSSEAIQAGKDLAEKAGLDIRLVSSNVYDLEKHIDETFDLVFCSYGSITWLPDLKRWGKIVERFLRPGGKFVMVEFHPLCWMYDDDFTGITYSYFNEGPMLFKDLGSYTDGGDDVELEYVSWNHPISEVMEALLEQQMELRTFKEYDYTPYDVFPALKETHPGEYRFEELGSKWPFLYGVEFVKSEAVTP